MFQIYSKSQCVEILRWPSSLRTGKKHKFKVKMKVNFPEQKWPPIVHFQVGKSFLHIYISYTSISSCLLKLA